MPNESHNNPVYDQLKELIDDQEHRRENECREYLQYVNFLLFRENFINLVNKEEEYRSHSGDSDYIISARIMDDRYSEDVIAYVWELKAPQCYIFCKERENRLIPSNDLVEAENQLLNYHYELRGSDQFRDTFRITHPDKIKLGGIIIGSERTKVKGEFTESKKDQLFNTACRIREKYFYSPNNFRLLNWTYILESMKQQKRTGEVVEGDTKEVQTNKVENVIVENTGIPPDTAGSINAAGWEDQLKGITGVDE